MHQDVIASRQRVSRRRLLAAGGAVGLGTLLQACGSAADDGTATVTTPQGTTATITPTTPGQSGGARSALIAELDDTLTCAMASEETQGPYWFDVESIRRDITEQRPGTELALVLRVHDASQCDAEGKPTPVEDAVVEIWHCDAGGVYSGFESGAGGPPGQSGGGATSDGAYSEGVQEATPTDDSTFLRGAQVTDEDGIARFTTIYPGWYRGRTVHIHLKVHLDKRNVLTTQLYFDDELTDTVLASEPYSTQGSRETRNDNDSIYDASGVLKVSSTADGYRGLLNLGIAAS